MTRTLIWDLPVRLFHWLFAAGFAAAAGISLILGEDSPLFPYHSIIGLALGLMVVLRVVWGIAGSRWARFGSFVFGPRETAAYMLSTLIGGGKRYIGHNPGSAVAIFAMLALMLGLAVTGIMMARGNEGPEELHEIMAYAILGVVVVHIVGVLVHTIRHKENLTLSMIRGTKDAESSQGIRLGHPLVAAVFIVIVGLWTGALLVNYNAGTQTTSIPLLGISLQIGEAEEGGGEGAGEGGVDDED
jgi:cytochrome b